MSDDILIAVIGGAVTVAVGVLAAAVALWVHHATEKSRRRDAKVDQQRLMVTRMLDTIDRAIQTRITPAIFRPWRDPTVDLMLALGITRAGAPAQETLSGTSSTARAAAGRFSRSTTTPLASESTTTASTARPAAPNGSSSTGSQPASGGSSRSARRSSRSSTTRGFREQREPFAFCRRGDNAAAVVTFCR